MDWQEPSRSNGEVDGEVDGEADGEAVRIESRVAETESAVGSCCGSSFAASSFAPFRVDVAAAVRELISCGAPKVDAVARSPEP